MKALLTVLLLGGAATATPAAPTSSATVILTVRGDPALTFSREVTSTVTLRTPFGQGSGLLLGGAPYPADPAHYWAGLKPLRLPLPVPPGTPPGRYPVTASTTLYVCDQKIHLCSVRPAQAAGTLEVGPGAAPLALTLQVPPLRSFR